MAKRKTASGRQTKPRQSGQAKAEPAPAKTKYPRFGIHCAGCDGLIQDEKWKRCTNCEEAIHNGCEERHQGTCDAAIRKPSASTATAEASASTTDELAEASASRTGELELFDLPCKFGGVAIEEEKAAIGVRLEGSVVAESKLSAIVVGGRLRVALVCEPEVKGDADGQTTMFGVKAEPRTISPGGKLGAIADCGQLAVKPRGFSFRLVFQRSAVTLSELANLARQAGRVSIERLAAAEDDPPVLRNIVARP